MSLLFEQESEQNRVRFGIRMIRLLDGSGLITNSHSTSFLSSGIIDHRLDGS